MRVDRSDRRWPSLVAEARARVSALAFVLLWLGVGAMLAGCTGEADNEAPSARPPPTATSRVGGPLGATPTPEGSRLSPGPAAARATATPEPGETAGVTPVASPQPVTPRWELTFERTGGFAGLAQRLTVNSQGEATFEDMDSGRLTEGRLSLEEMTQLRRLLEGSEFFSQDVSQSRACFDCFNYSVTLMQDSQSRLVRANSLGLDPRLEPLVLWLADLLGKELRP